MPKQLSEADFEVAEADAPRFTALLAHARTVPADWRALPFERGGNFVRARWCSPTVRAPACEGGAVLNDAEPGTAWRALSTLAYDSGWPKTFGVVWNAGQIPLEGIGVSMFFAQSGRGVVGESFGANAYEVAGGKVVRKAAMAQWELTVGAGTFRVAPPATPAESIAPYVGGAAAYREAVAAGLDALSGQIEAAAAAHSLQVWEEGPYMGGGIPPERIAVPASPAAEAELLREARADLAARRALLLDNAETIAMQLASLWAK